jgi:hypothetical protein
LAVAHSRGTSIRPKIICGVKSPGILLIWLAVLLVAGWAIPVLVARSDFMCTLLA